MRNWHVESANSKGIQKFEPLFRSHPGRVNILQIGRNEAGFANQFRKRSLEVNVGQIYLKKHRLGSLVKHEMRRLEDALL